jgi:hypothetical protein
MSSKHSILALLLFFIFISGCRHAPSHADSVELVNNSFLKYQKVEIPEAKSNSERYEKKSLSISGTVVASDVREISEDIKMLSILVEVHSPDPEGILPANIDYFLEEIIANTSEIINRLQSDYENDILDSTYNVKVASRRLIALGNYYSATGNEDVGEIIESIGKGYEEISEGYSQLMQKDPEFAKVEKLKIQIVDDGSEDPLVGAELSLSGLSEFIISNRENIFSLELKTNSAQALKESGHRALSIGYLSIAESLKRERTDGFHDDSDKNGKALAKIGRGLVTIGEGFLKIKDKLSSDNRKDDNSNPNQMRFVYIGFNSSTIRAVHEKMSYMKNHPITIRGTLARDDLIGEFDVIFVRIEGIEFDDLNVDMSYGDISQFRHKTMKTYKFLKQFN